MKDQHSPLLNALLAEINPIEQAKTDAKMEIAAKIALAMEAKNWKKKDLLEAIDKDTPSIITKWLSGTHNFTIDTLVELEKALEIKLLDREIREQPVIEYRIHVSGDAGSSDTNSYFNDIINSKKLGTSSKTVEYQA